jgi:hypothetical protein
MASADGHAERKALLLEPRKATMDSSSMLPCSARWVRKEKGLVDGIAPPKEVSE